MDVTHLQVDGRNLVGTLGRLSYAAAVAKMGAASNRGCEPLTVSVLGWPELVADVEAGRYLQVLAVRGADAGITVVIHGLDRTTASRLAHDAGLDRVRDAIVAGVVMTVVPLPPDPPRYALSVDASGALAGVAAVPVEHRPHVAAGLRRAAEMLAPTDDRCPLCMGGPRLRPDEWPQHLLVAHVGARGAAAR